MSNRIEVDTAVLRDVSAKTDSFIASLKSKREILKNYGNELATVWQGADATKFQKRYNAIVSDTGFAEELIDALESYRDYLKYCAERYEKTAEAAVSRANGIW
ncbi:MAG: WXG100 family type VII secretion target [Lachnospiraceae bacterium]|nr:WXG100 family type VII secretion target [Lachnospiraceae bacterium]